MGKRSRGGAMDFSSFMCVILMLIGILMILLVSNILSIMSNPENVQISSVIHSAMYVPGGPQELEGQISIFPKFANKSKEPTYVDVYRDRFVIYPDEAVVQGGEMERPGNAFEKLLSRIVERKDREYIILLVRPRSATMFRRLRTAIKDRGVDVGYELYETGRPVELKQVETAAAGG